MRSSFCKSFPLPLTHLPHFTLKSFTRQFFSPPDFLKFGQQPNETSNVLTHHQKIILPYKPEQVYLIVSDVNKYSEFVPWCTKSQVHTIKKHQSVDHLTASLSIGFSAFSETYTSHVKCHPHSIVEARNFNSSLFKELLSRWKLSSHPTGGCEVTFEIRFELNSSLYASLSRMYFQKVTQAMVEAFENRCKIVYR